MRLGKLKTGHCGICGESLPPRKEIFQWNPHLERVHPDYLRWVKRWLRNTLLFGISSVLILILADFFALNTDNLPLLFSTNVLYIVAMQVVMVRLPLKKRQVKRQWKEEHG